ncbi:hypothetical protein IPG36_05275 [bacterium]|nr:MAG: hypothetical protein IPG36_05275 [bacterium]
MKRLPSVRVNFSMLRKPVNVSLVSALIISTIAIGLPAVMQKYREMQAKFPIPLAAQDIQPNIQSNIAEVSQEKAQALPKTLQQQLDNDKDNISKGKKVDRTPIKTLDESRTSNQKVFLNADGSKTFEHSFDNTSYKDSTGWHDVDPNIYESTDGNWSNGSNSWKSTFKAKATVELKQGNSILTLTPSGTSAVKPTITGTERNQKLLYRNTWPGIDIEYSVSGSAIKENIIIKSKAAAKEYIFDTGGHKLTNYMNRNGWFQLSGDLSGFVIPAPTVATKSNGVIGAEPFVTQRLIKDKLVVTVDEEWLSKLPTDAFPVIVDPTIDSVSWADAYVNYRSDGFICYSGQGCGNSAGASGGTYWRFQAYIPNNIPAGNFITYANFHVELPDCSGTYGTCDGHGIDVRHATDNCNNLNCGDNTYGIASGWGGASIDVNATQLFKNMYFAGQNSEYIWVNGEETGNSLKRFAYDRTKVTFTYEALPSQSTRVAPAEGATVSTNQPTLKSTTSTDSDGPGPLLYRYLVGSSKLTPIQPYNVSMTGMVADSWWTNQPFWTIPDGILQDGSTYYWQVCVWDSYQDSHCVYSPTVNSFKVDLRKGQDSTQSYDTTGTFAVSMATGNVSTSTESHAIAALGGSLGVSFDYNSPYRSKPGLLAEFFNNPTHSTTFPSSNAIAEIKRVDSEIDFSWGTNTPHAGTIGTDWFFGRWTGWYTPTASGSYTFGGINDDKMVVTVSGQSVYDNNGCGGSGCFGTTAVNLTAGQPVPIKVEYREDAGEAHAHLLAKLGANPGQVITSANLQTGIMPVTARNGLTGRYYTDTANHTFPANEIDPTRLFLTRPDTGMSFNWGDGSPVPGGPTENFMVRWSGWFTAPVTDNYTFGTDSDDGVRIKVNNVTKFDSFASPVLGEQWGSSTGTLSANQTIPITIEYYEASGSAQFKLLLKRDGASPAGNPVIDASTLSSRANVLPDGWELGGVSGGGLQYEFAFIGSNSVVLRDTIGDTHEYRWSGTNYTPPTGESGHLVRNGDNTVTFEDAGGQTYIFGSDGFIRASSNPLDDLQPAAFNYSYSTPTTGGAAHLTQISDGVSASRWVKIAYTDDATNTCPSAPTNTNLAPSGMICGVTTSDGQVTKLGYLDVAGVPRLARVEYPGGAIIDYGYDPNGRIISYRDSLANDAISAGQRLNTDTTIQTDVQYDDLGRASTVILPAAQVAASRLTRNFEYLIGSSKLHIAGAAEPNGFSRRIVYDSSWRTLEDTDVANLTNYTEWDIEPGTSLPRKDLVHSTTDPLLLKTAINYDFADRPTDIYGPAPNTWFSANSNQVYTPVTNVSSIPRAQSVYDENINTLAAAYYNEDTSTKSLVGAPKKHTTGLNPADKGVYAIWGTNWPGYGIGQPITPDSGKGWGIRATGWIRLLQTGTYNWRAFSDDGFRIVIDDKVVIDDWRDTGYRQLDGSYANSGDSWHRVRIEKYTAPGTLNDARLDLCVTRPDAYYDCSIQNWGWSAGYGLSTTNKVYDSSIGDTTTTTNFGPNPEYGLPQSVTVNPTGLNYTGSSSFETPGTGSYLRQTSKTLPGGTTSTYSYYTATDTADNPCTAGTTESYKQAGLSKLITEQDPDSSGTLTGRKSEVIYDDAGRIVASRMIGATNQTDPWSCTTYDTRGRVTQKVTPTVSGRVGRTISYNYAVSGNPLVGSSTDSVAGTTSVTIDLLGRTTNTTDVFGYATTTTYDNLGRVNQTTSLKGTEVPTYDNLNRLTGYTLDGVTYATLTYDAYSRINDVQYPQASNGSNNLRLSQITRDNKQRHIGSTYSFADNSTISETIGLSPQKGLVTSDTITKGAQSAGASYQYDTLVRLTQATIDNWQYQYGFSTQQAACTSIPGYNANAHKNGNRTSTSITNTLNSQNTTSTSCYSAADRLASSTDTQIGTPTYDDHGNITQLAGAGAPIQFTYDASDQNTKIQQGTNWTEYVKSAGGAVLIKREYRNSVLDKVYRNAGGVLLTCATTDQNSCSNVENTSVFRAAQY